MRKPQKAQTGPPAIVAQSYEIVPIADLIPHPKNARKSDNAAIDESIQANGFFGAVYVQRSTRHILAGTHSLERAAAAGMEKVPVIWLDVDNRTALRILSADNRTADRAGYDDEALSELLTTILSECGSLAGSGFLPKDLDKIIAEVGDQVLQAAPDIEEPPAQLESPPLGIVRGDDRMYLVVIRCKDEFDQLDLLRRFSDEGLDCRPAQEPTAE